MNKLKFHSTGIIAALLVAIVVFSTTIFVSCKKDAAETTKTANKPFAVETDDMNAYLAGFKTRLQSGLKSGETLETEEAVWHLTALLNYDYGDAGHEFSEFVNDTSHIVVSKTGDGISYEQLGNAYADLQEFVATSYENSNLDDKKVYVVVSTVTSEDNENIHIQTVATLGSRGSFPTTFGATDYWWEGFRAGKCGPYQGQYQWERDATTELTKMLNINLGILAAVGGGRVYFTDIEWEYLDHYYGDNPEEDPNSPCGYRIFYNETYSETGMVCLDPAAMNYYLWSYNDMGITHKPTGKHIMSFLVSYGLIIPTYSYPTFHVLEINYGKANVAPGGGFVD